ncbi:Ff.00g035270.m01.CDS01 [Fusarium sp. VM40]|nr:Ff.00g035270.m01.CDS01 [Fusarium sp. VM40]
METLKASKTQDSAVRYLAILDNYTMVFASRDCTVRLWTLESDQLESRNVLHGHTAEVRNIQVHGDVIVSGSYDADARVWNTEIGDCLHVLHGHRSHVNGVAFDGKRVATSSTDGDIRICDSETGNCTATFVGHESKAKNVSHIRLVGDALISGGADGSIELCALSPIDASPRELASSDGGGTAISTVGFQGDHVIVGTTGGSVKIIDCQSGETLCICTNGTCGIAISQVGFTLEYNPAVVCLKD